MSVKKTPTASHLIFGLAGGDDGAEAALIKNDVVVKGGRTEKPTLVKSILNLLNGPENSIERLAFETDPTQHNNYAGIYKAKLRLLPDDVLKRIAIQDSLVSNIVRARQNHVAAHGRPRPNRFSTGFVIAPEQGVVEKLDAQGKVKLNERISAAVKRLAACGSVDGVPDEHQATFAEYLNLSARSAVVCGRIATEIVWGEDESGNKVFHHFVAADAGTIYKAASDPSQVAAESVRAQAFEELQRITGKTLTRETWEKKEYPWVQVIHGRPYQVFTSDEMKVYNFYAVPDLELDGYPVTPIDTVITAVTTHINIVSHNKLYFQSGRAARGMLIIKSDDVTPTTVHNIKQQFNASINNVNNAWRMPVFSHGADEEIGWHPIDSGGGRDMEFQYLTDMNAREILTAFMMSPDELPGWSYLSRGTANQALSESNNEYKLQAARDVGIRPLLMGFEDFINAHLLPLIDPELAKDVRVKLVGLDSDNPEKEAVRTQQDMGIWMSYDDVLERVEKKPVGEQWGGNIPLNQVYKSYLDQYYTVGEILERFCNRKDASKDPSLAYRRDPFFFQWVQLQQQAELMKANAAQQGGAPPSGGGGGGGAGGGDVGGGGAGENPSQGGGSGGEGEGGAHAMGNIPTERQKSSQVEEASASGAGDLARSIDIAFDSMQKNETSLPADLRRVLFQQRKAEEHALKGFKTDAEDAVKEILAVAKHHAPKK